MICSWFRRDISRSGSIRDAFGAYFQCRWTVDADPSEGGFGTDGGIATRGLIFKHCSERGLVVPKRITASGGARRQKYQDEFHVRLLGCLKQSFYFFCLCISATFLPYAPNSPARRSAWLLLSSSPVGSGGVPGESFGVWRSWRHCAAQNRFLQR